MNLIGSKHSPFTRFSQLIVIMASIAVTSILFLDAALASGFGVSLIGFSSGKTTLYLGLTASTIAAIYIFSKALSYSLSNPIQVAIVAIIMHYLLGPFLIIYNEWWAFPYERAGLDSEESFHLGFPVIVAALGSLALPIIYYGLSSKREMSLPGSLIRTSLGMKKVTFLILFACAMSLVSTIVKLKVIGGIGNIDDQFRNRRLYSAGYGFLEIFSHAGYVGVIIIAWYYTIQNRWTLKKIVAVSIVSAIAGLPYFVSGHRGGALYGFLMAGITVLACGVRSKLVPLAPLLIVAVLQAEHYTGNIRLAYSTRGELFDWQGLPERNEYPSSFRHAELVTCAAKLRRGHGGKLPDTLIPSIINWIPRFIKKEKPLTTGPTLAKVLAPEWFNRSGKHTSSLTTGPIVELFYNFGYLGTCFGMFLLGILYCLIEGYYSKRRGRLAPYLIICLPSLFAWVEAVG